MGESTVRLRERMLRDAIVDVLRGLFDPCCEEKGISVVEIGLLRDVVVDGDCARVELVLTPAWCPFAARLVTEVQQQVESLPEVARAEVEVVWDEAWSTARHPGEAPLLARSPARDAPLPPWLVRSPQPGPSQWPWVLTPETFTDPRSEP